MIVDWGSLIKERACMSKQINISNIIPIRPKVLFSSRKERLFLLYFNIFNNPKEIIQYRIPKGSP